jgi:hypothetical protein
VPTNRLEYWKNRSKVQYQASKMGLPADHPRVLEAVRARTPKDIEEEEHKYLSAQAKLWNGASGDSEEKVLRRFLIMYRVAQQDWLARTQKRIRRDSKYEGCVLDGIRLPVFCPILNVPLLYDARKGAPNQPSLDRIDSSKGYVDGNVHVISLRANILKRDATPEELRALGRWAESLKI